jgi:hypothetical protein
MATFITQSELRASAQAAGVEPIKGDVVTGYTHISRKRHDALLDSNPGLLRHVLRYYNPRWSLAGVTVIGLPGAYRAAVLA